MSNKENLFEYTYSSNINKEVELIRNKYVNKEEDKLEQLKKLDKSAEKPGTILSICLGTFGTLLFGSGLAICLELTETHLMMGIILGIVGMIIIASAFPCYKYVTKKQRKKIASKVIELSEEILK